MVHLAFTSVAAWLFLLVFPEHWHINNEPQAWWRERSMPLWPLSTQYGSRCRWGNDATAWLDYYNSILVSPSDPCPVPVIPVPVIPVPVIDNWDRDDWDRDDWDLSCLWLVENAGLHSCRIYWGIHSMKHLWWIQTRAVLKLSWVVMVLAELITFRLQLCSVCCDHLYPSSEPELGSTQYELCYVSCYFFNRSQE